MSPLGWFLLGVVAGFVVAMVVWSVNLGRMVAAAVREAEALDARVVEEVLARHRAMRERGGRVRVGER